MNDICAIPTAVKLSAPMNTALTSVNTRIEMPTIHAIVRVTRA